jgi:hypothetical protein
MERDGCGDIVVGLDLQADSIDPEEHRVGIQSRRRRERRCNALARETEGFDVFDRSDHVVGRRRRWIRTASCRPRDGRERGRLRTTVPRHGDVTADVGGVLVPHVESHGGVAALGEPVAGRVVEDGSASHGFGWGHDERKVRVHSEGLLV